MQVTKDPVFQPVFMSGGYLRLYFTGHSSPVIKTQNYPLSGRMPAALKQLHRDLSAVPSVQAVTITVNGCTGDYCSVKLQSDVQWTRELVKKLADIVRDHGLQPCGPVPERW